MSWKIGQKLVYIDDTGDNLKPTWIVPKIGEIVTYHGECNVHKGNVDITEYLRGSDGVMQSFKRSRFRPIETRKDAKKDLLNQFIEVPETSDCPIETTEPVSNHSSRFEEGKEGVV